jgi:ethanolamine ammonia-lyase small subunit
VSDERPSDPPEGEQVVANPWQFLRAYTTARIALGRAGGSLPTSRQLEFQLAHARARDAVHSTLDAAALERELRSLGLETLRLHSAAPDRATYLQRPDLGRRLDDHSRQWLSEQTRGEPGSFDAAFIIADGLSALAVQRHTVPMLAAALSRIEAERWRIAPIIIVEQGRVAVGDEIGALLGADLAIILIGERPGLSAPDSLGIYLTYAPRPGRTDAARNCISNIREAGLSYSEAAHKLTYLMSESHRLRLSGINLKDEARQLDRPADSPHPARNLLVNDE